MLAIRVHRPGGPEEMRLEDVPSPTPGPGQARVQVAFSGVNFIDVYHRAGAYPRCAGHGASASRLWCTAMT